MVMETDLVLEKPKSPIVEVSGKMSAQAEVVSDMALSPIEVTLGKRSSPAGSGSE